MNRDEFMMVNESRVKFLLDLEIKSRKNTFQWFLLISTIQIVLVVLLMFFYNTMMIPLFIGILLFTGFLGVILYFSIRETKNTVSLIKKELFEKPKFTP